MYIIKQHESFAAFLKGIRDSKVRGAIAARIDRLSFGNPGDSESVGSGVCELRIHLGADGGYIMEKSATRSFCLSAAVRKAGSSATSTPR